MAKSVLDLYELYNLVIARGGLVDVINKKLWQEIIKGLHLPSSITSAAFTLRTQYMKYLYPYECEKRRLSTPAELQAAIDGNRREGRRSSYGQYDASGMGGGGNISVAGMQRSPNSAQMSPLTLVAAQQQQQQHHLAARMSSVMGAAAAGLQGMGLHNGAHHPSHPTPLGQPLNGGPLPGLAPSEFEARMMEYVKLLNKEIRSSAAAAAATTPPPSLGRMGGNGDCSPPGGATSPSALLNPLEMSRMTLWNLYNNNHHPKVVEPQKEALNLADSQQLENPYSHLSAAVHNSQHHHLPGLHPGLHHLPGLHPHLPHQQPQHPQQLMSPTSVANIMAASGGLALAGVGGVSIKREPELRDASSPPQPPAKRFHKDNAAVPRRRDTTASDMDDLAEEEEEDDEEDEDEGAATARTRPQQPSPGHMANNRRSSGSGIGAGDADESMLPASGAKQTVVAAPQAPSTHIKINSRGDNGSGDNSLMVSMELNGIMYQGVLFAQSQPRTAIAS